MSTMGDTSFDLVDNPMFLAAGLITASPLGMGLNGKYSGVWKIPGWSELTLGPLFFMLYPQLTGIEKAW